VLFRLSSVRLCKQNRTWVVAAQLLPELNRMAVGCSGGRAGRPQLHASTDARIASLTHIERQTATPAAASKFSPVPVGKCRHRTLCQPSYPPAETPKSSCCSTSVHLSHSAFFLVRAMTSDESTTCPQVRAQATHSLSACPPQAPGGCPHPLWITCFATHSSARTVTRVERRPVTFGGLSEPGRNVPRTVIDDQLCQHLVELELAMRGPL